MPDLVVIQLMPGVMMDNLEQSLQQRGRKPWAVQQVPEHDERNTPRRSRPRATRHRPTPPWTRAVYRDAISRLARALLVVATLAVVFAPGLLSNETDRSANDVAAAVLAPTSEDGASMPAARPRNFTGVFEFVALVSAAVALLSTPRWVRTRRDRQLSALVSIAGQPLSRRGPPLRVA